MDTGRDSGLYRARAVEISEVDDFADARSSLSPAERLHLIRARSLRFRERMLSAGRVRYFETFDLVRVPYPTKYGLRDAFAGNSPFMHIQNRVMIIQYDSEDGLKTLLFSPSDVRRNAETPFFKRLAGSFGKFGGMALKVLAPQQGTVESALEQAGIAPEQVDYISYDHLHTQDLRRWLGTQREPAFFPNARLLVMRQEWESTKGLLAPQRDWYCPGGIDGIDEHKVVKLDSDVLLGDGAALVRTPGHTEGNQSLVVHTDKGLVVASENGVAADSYAPLKSKVPGVREYARNTGMEVVLNGNTMERGLDQYISMVKEKTIAGPCADHPDFFNIYPSSEMTPFALFPSTKPTFSFGLMRYGAPSTARRASGEQSSGRAA